MQFSNASGSQNRDLFFYLIVFPVGSRLSSDPPVVYVMISKTHVTALDSCATFLSLFCCKETHISCSYNQLFFFFFLTKSFLTNQFTIKKICRGRWGAGVSAQCVIWDLISLTGTGDLTSAAEAWSLYLWTSRQLLFSSFYCGPDLEGREE